MASTKSSNNNESHHQQEQATQSNGHANNPLTDKNYLTLTSQAQNGRVICDDMVYYCFDVLNSYFQKHNDLRTPNFPNNEFPLFGKISY